MKYETKKDFFIFAFYKPSAYFQRSLYESYTYEDLPVSMKPQKYLLHYYLRTSEYK